MGIQINGNTNNINAGIGSLSIEDLNELDIVGVATASNFKTGVSNLHNVGLTLSGGQIDVGSNIKLGNAGVITATSFVGSGANLTGLSGVSVANQSNNRLITATGTTDALNGEANLTFDGTNVLEIASGYPRVRVKNTGTSASANDIFGAIEFEHSDTDDAGITAKIQAVAEDNAGNSFLAFYNGDGGNADERLRITSDGNIRQAWNDGKFMGQYYDSTYYMGFTFGATARTLYIDNRSNDTRADIVFRTGESASLGERLRITSAGKIGIGLTNPASLLHLSGSAPRITLTDTAGTDDVAKIFSYNGALYFQQRDGSSHGNIIFRTENSSTAEERLRIKSDGNFAIGNSHGAKKIHISTSGNQKILIDPNYNNNSGGSSNSEANANNVVDSVLIRTSFGDNAASQTNAGHKWGIKFQGYNGNDFTQNTSKIAAVYAVSEDEAGGYNRNVGLTFHTSPYNTTHREVMRINTNGAVTKPYHPAFAARLGSGNINIASSTGTDIVFNTQEFDNSNSYDTSNGRFTAPVAGKYYFGVQLYGGFDGAGVRVMHSHFRVNGTSVAQADMFGGASNHGGTHYHPTAAGHMIRELNKNDYVTFNIGGFAHTGGQAILYASTGNRFFGYLVA